MDQTHEVTCALRNRLRGKVFTRGDDEYDAALAHYDSTQEQELRPCCVVFPGSTEDVATVIQILSRNGTKFAVTSGGCMFAAGAGNIEGGVTINLRRLNQLVVGSDRTVVSVGAGLRWGEVYEQLDPHGLAIMGGRVGNVGVGGLTLGGGISAFSGKHGFVCDNVINFVVVLASGEVVRANARENRDLWVALRGGSSNFGIVTSFDFPAFPQGKLFAGWIISDTSMLESRLQSFEKLVENYDPNVGLTLVVGWDQRFRRFYTVTGMSHSEGETNAESLRPFLEVQPRLKSTLRLMSLSEFAKDNRVMFRSGVRLDAATATFRNSSAMMQTITQLWKDSIKKVESIKGISWSISFQPIVYHLVGDISHSENSLGLTPSDGPLVLFLLSAGYDAREDEETVTDAARDLIMQIDEATKAAGLYHALRYLNYAPLWQDSIASYGPDSLKRLRAASRKYDPQGMFQKQSPGGFKVWSPRPPAGHL